MTFGLTEEEKNSLSVISQVHMAVLAQIIENKDCQLLLENCSLVVTEEECNTSQYASLKIMKGCWCS